MPQELLVKIVGDSKSYERALNRSASATNQFGNALGQGSPKLGKLNSLLSTGRLGAVAFAGAAAGLAVSLGAKSINAASDLNEQISRTQVVMGKSSDAMIKWSETTAESMGISQRAALAAAGTFAGLFQTVGLGVSKAAELSKSLVGLAADLASLQNTSPEEALVALRSGLAGEAEPLRRFNIFLSEARVQQQALADTGKKTTASLTTQEKVLARYKLIMQDSVLAQGNFALTSKGLANQQRILAAQVDDLSAKLGAVLIPAVTGVVGALIDVVSAGEDVVDVLKQIGDIPGIEIPIKLVSSITGGGGAANIIQHIVLGGISPLGLGIKIGVEIAQGIRQGAGDPLKDVPVHPSADTQDARENAQAQNLVIANARAGQAAIERITKASRSSSIQQLRDSETRAAHIRDLLRKVGPTDELQKRLTAELAKQETLRTKIASDAKEQATADKAAAKAVQDQLIATFDLADARAGLTKSLQDDLAAAKGREATLKHLVSLSRQDADLQNQLVAATAARRDIEKEIADNKRKERVKSAFKALGLTPEGEAPTPGSAALLNKAKTLQNTIKGTVLDTKKTRTQLRKIVAFLKTHLKGTEREIRQAILDMLNGIADAGDTDKKKGPLTKTHGLDTSKLVQNLGLTPEQQNELRGRLSKFNTAGRALGGNRTNAPGGSGRIPGQHGGPSGPFIVESHTTINIDGQKVANVVTRNQQKTKRRNPAQKRGPNRR